MDLELAAQVDPSADFVIAIDAIDEYLSNLEKVGKHSPEFAPLRGHGERLAFRVRDTSTLWAVTFDEDGFNVSQAEDTFDAELVGSPVDLLLAILRRRDLAQGEIEVNGDRHLVEFWLAHSDFE